MRCMKTTFGADFGFGDVIQLFGFLILFLSSLCVFGSLLIDLTLSFFFDIDVDLIGHFRGHVTRL